MTRRQRRHISPTGCPWTLPLADALGPPGEQGRRADEVRAGLQCDTALRLGITGLWELTLRSGTTHPSDGSSRAIGVPAAHTPIRRRSRRDCTAARYGHCPHSASGSMASALSGPKETRSAAHSVPRSLSRTHEATPDTHWQLRSRCDEGLHQQSPATAGARGPCSLPRLHSMSDSPPSTVGRNWADL